MKTRIKLRDDVPQSVLKKDDVGYIDGYVTGGNGRPYAAVVIGKTVGLVMLYNLEVLES